MTTTNNMPSIPGATLDEVKRYVITTTYESTNRSTALTAKILGISPRTVQTKVRAWGLGRGRGRPAAEATP